MTAAAEDAERRPPSLMRRIVLRLSLITAIATVIAYAVLEYQTFSSIGELHTDSLRGVARHLARSLILPPGRDRPLLVLPEGTKGFAKLAEREYHFAVRGPDGTIIHDNGWKVGPMPKADPDEEDGTLYEHDPDGMGPEDYAGIVMPRIIDGKTYWVQVEQSNDQHLILVQAIAEDFFDDGGWAIIPFLLALLAGSILTIHKTLTPLDNLSWRAAQIGPDTNDIRLPEQDIPSEVLPLVRAFNKALDRLEDGYRMQREFTADAAHELRTPLAVLRAQVDLLPADRQTQSLRTGIETLTRLVAQMLMAARMDVLTVARDDVADLHEVALEVAEFLTPLAVRQCREIEVSGHDGPMPVRGNPEALFDALRNLAENALTHSPPGGVVSLDVGREEIAVVDRGSGISAEARPHLFARFWRADRNKSGAGLGLAIVQRIAEAHGAVLRVEDTPGGGATFRLVFPHRT